MNYCVNSQGLQVMFTSEQITIIGGPRLQTIVGLTPDHAAFQFQS